ncbi:putative phage tail protein [Bacillus sp. JJ722]|uniref:putative phage tail protein n=1 Tax=Bacillus sp. JJ722 TaxID=3122973 RepID=UPI002FFF9C18
MLNYLPIYLRKSGVFKEIIASDEKQFEKGNVDIDDLRNQMLIDTATWALPIYEKELNIIPVPNSSLEERRAVIKAKWQSQSKLDRILLETVASSILQTIVTVGFDGRIVFKLELAPDKQLGNFKTFYQVIDDMKPAHLNHIISLDVEDALVIEDKVSYKLKTYHKVHEFKVGMTPIKYMEGEVIP